MLFFIQKFIDGDCRVTWSDVVVQHSCECLFPVSFKDLPIKSLIVSLSWWNKFLVDDPLSVKKKTIELRFYFGFVHSRFLWMRRVCIVSLPNLAFCLGVVL